MTTLDALRWTLLLSLSGLPRLPALPVMCADNDRDGVCNPFDRCLGDDAVGDGDADGTCDDADLCLGDDAVGDGDTDGSCDDTDRCVGDDAVLDPDVDGVCGALDICLGDDALGDSDHDGSCDDRDACVGHDRTGDRDQDGICDDVDPCDDTIVAPGTSCVLPSPVPTNACVGSPVLFEGRHTGFVECPDGAINRLFPTSGWMRPETWAVDTSPTYYGYVHQCLADADCAALPNGACVRVTRYYITVNECRYGCEGDADCGAGRICLPPAAGFTRAPTVDRTYIDGHPTDGRGHCVAARCTDASSCPSTECGYTWNHAGCGGDGDPILACRDTAVDTCRVAADCPRPRYDVMSCNYGTSFRCRDATLSCGRPYTAGDGEGLTAPSVVRADWSAGASVRASVESAAELAEHWRNIGALEHASVASFARHALELMLLGAPAELLAEVVAAQQDEIEHARLAYGLAAAYAGEEVGPGPLPISGSLRTDRGAILAGLVEEGCIGETVAAAEAALCAARATDPAVRAVLERIAADEARHAALAWRTARWMVQGWPEGLERVSGIVEAAMAEVVGGAWAADDVHGVMSEGERRSLRAEVLRVVVRPVIGALVGGGEAGGDDGVHSPLPLARDRGADG